MRSRLHWSRHSAPLRQGLASAAGAAQEDSPQRRSSQSPHYEIATPVKNRGNTAELDADAFSQETVNTALFERPAPTMASIVLVVWRSYIVAGLAITTLTFKYIQRTM